MTILASVNNKTVMPGITPIADVPDTPTIGTATAVGLAASITFTAATTGGTPTTFTATSNPGSLTGTASSSPVTVSGLTDATSYTFTVTAGNSTGTSPASSASNSITAVVPISGGYDALATVTVGSTAVSSITFAGIPSGYKHLQLRFIARSSRSDYTVAALLARFNGDTATNYSGHYLGGDGASIFVYGGAGYTFAPAGLASGANSGANIFSPGVLDILDYSNTNKYKTTRAVSGFSRNTTSDEINLQSGNWRNTSTINSITFTLETSANFLQYSQFSLYGVK